MNENIIIVEDEFIVAEDLRIIVEKAGNIVPGIASSVEEGIELISRHQPGLVLLDINLEGKLTGIDLAQKLKEEAIPFIYISAYSNQSILEAANATQPYGFLVKPFRERDVLVAIDIARYRYENSLESTLRREQFLVQSLELIHTSAETPENKLLKIALKLQYHVPFDYLDIRITNSGMSSEGISFLRLGMEEYQKIGSTELLTITGLKPDELKKIQQTVAIEKRAAFYNRADFNNSCTINPLKKLVADTFDVVSNLTLPVHDLNNEHCIFSFYSRKKNAYNEAHLALFERLNNVLSKASMYISSGLKKQATAEELHIYNFEGIVGNDPALINLLDKLAQVAPFDTSVIIQGETGTGKERLAQCIHQLSDRSKGPMIKINCAVLPPNLIESELFGHEKGAFTGAIDRRIGKFEQANNGTIFLDEIGEMPIDMQAKLLRVLQEREIERIGGKLPIKVNVRIIAATNKVLEKEVGEGRFRMDLFYRLNVFPLLLPPLRERKTDIAQLAIYFAERFCSKFKKAFIGITPQMMQALTEYHWPGNIRELENVIEQSVVLNNGKSGLELSRQLSTSHPLKTEESMKHQPSNLEDIKKLQSKTEKDYIISILKRAAGRIRGEGGAAQLLNLPPTTLESRMTKLGIKKNDYL